MCLIFNLHTSQCICYKGERPFFSHLSAPSLCFIPPSFEPTQGKKEEKKEAALKILHLIIIMSVALKISSGDKIIV